MPIRRTRVFGHNQFVKIIKGTYYRFQIVKIKFDLTFEGSNFSFTVKLTRKTNLQTQESLSSATISGTFI